MNDNIAINNLPKHLLNFVVEQPYSQYTHRDHALWRYIMRQNVDFLKDVAHESYLEGLSQTGISIDKIPRMSDMNGILNKIGWGAVAVDGFIPPDAFMEFQAYNILVIAADIRPINQIEYTPAPDIIHEAAGHAPIIANYEYAEYLRFFGKIGSKAFSSLRDYELYEAIRHLSILKADPNTPQKKIREAEISLSEIDGNMGEPSEMALIRNLHWWTVEYGLIGDLRNPKIYGAGLLSSIGESYNCLQSHVKKIPYKLDTAYYSFDITSQQPQLFVTPDFPTLTDVLNQFADKMALRRGGLYGLNKAITSKNTATCEYSSGLQVSGTIDSVMKIDNNPVYIKTTGPTSLNYKGKELYGHSKNYHSEGFGSPVGKLKNIAVPIEHMSDGELETNGIATGDFSKLEFENGILVEGLLTGLTKKDGKVILMTFSDCKVTYGDEILFAPDWGYYDMAVGEKIISVFSGPADHESFGISYDPPGEKTHKIEFDQTTKNLFGLYRKVRYIREEKIHHNDISGIWEEIKENYQSEWLIMIEILEIIEGELSYNDLAEEIQLLLNKFKENNKDLTKLIEGGIKLALA